jgi:hypothetical protein
MCGKYQSGGIRRGFMANTHDYFQTTGFEGSFELREGGLHEKMEFGLID